MRPKHRFERPIIEAYSLLETYDAERNRLQRECYFFVILIRCLVTVRVVISREIYSLIHIFMHIIYQFTLLFLLLFVYTVAILVVDSIVSSMLEQRMVGQEVPWCFSLLEQFKLLFFVLYLLWHFTIPVIVPCFECKEDLVWLVIREMWVQREEQVQDLIKVHRLVPLEL